jgi:hypothetical protein
MTLTLELPPDVEARLQAEAAARGMELSEYALRRLFLYPSNCVQTV